MFQSVDAAVTGLARQRYAATREIATAVYLSLELARPLFVEGAHGTGKTALAAAIAGAIDAPLIRIACYRGMDPERAAFSWDYAAQAMRMAQLSAGDTRAGRAIRLRSKEYVIEGPLLKAISGNGVAPLLLVDDIHEGGPAFEAFLAEFLNTQALEVPGLGVVRAPSPPRVIMAGNGQATSALAHDAQYLWIDYPDHGREVEILHARVPGLPPSLSGEICTTVAAIRAGKFRQRPGVGESIDWARALVALHRAALDEDTVNETLGCVLKHPADIARFRRERVYEQIAEQRLDVAG